MPMTNAEIQRRYYLKKKEREKQAPDAADQYFKTPFQEYMSDSWSVLDVFFESLGIKDWPRYEKDTDDIPEWWKEENGIEGNRGTLGRAELMVGFLKDAATELASEINNYKKQELTQRITELEQSADLNEKEIKRLQTLLSKLDKPVRDAIPRWKTTDLF